ncbi:MAG: DUF1015 domain-containing protein [Sedimentisphaerales bacterium]|nr:DUF1015 domain-containing protein [Sedimentisphaerales bacterium]
MVIRPFKAYRYNKDIVKDIGGCIAPPYDVIDDSLREQLAQQSNFNIVRLIRPQAEGNNQNPYEVAAGLLGEWLKKGVLKQDQSEAIYAYVQDFEIAGAWFHRLSFIALGKLEPFGDTVRAHENTLDGPKKDRLELKKATEADLGLVYLIYEDEENIADDILEEAVNGEALIDFTDFLSVRHRLFAVTDKQSLKNIIDMMSDKICIVADGHHRYETGLKYAELSGNPAAQYQMMAFSNTRHDGLIVLATHRMISNLTGFDFKELIEKLGENFDVQKIPVGSGVSVKQARHKMLARMKEGHAKDENIFGIYGGNGAFYVATLRNQSAMNEKAPQMSKPWRKLDVAVLSRLVLDCLLGIDKDKLAKGNYVVYVKDSGGKSKELVKMIDDGKGQVVFFMNPPRIKQIQDVAAAGERMPQKSTYFYPKVFTGLTINKL